MASLEEYCTTAFKSACIAELEALKPGNVHIFADGHGMRVQDFMHSAEAAAGPISRAESTVGQRILHAIQATKQAVGCNTNLGIVLLAAPLIQAAHLDASIPFKNRLSQVLGNLTQQDAVEAFEAIRIASPAGLGASSKHDVNETPHVSLLKAMQAAAERDMVAQQYANGYREIFDAIPHYHSLVARWARPAWAVTAVYLRFLSSFPDSHVIRKYGIEVAENVRQQALSHWHALESMENPKNYLRPLLEFDSDLKARDINPGTSADMTVAVLLLIGLAC